MMGLNRPKNPEAQARKLEQMVDDLMECFTWGQTSQGAQYWNDVYLHLSSLAMKAKYRKEIF